jgi:uncharacterized protein YdaU (DUF1376 family)
MTAEGTTDEHHHLEDPLMLRFSLHVGDYTTATADLTLAEHGAYLKLLLHYYATEQALPPDPAKLYRIAAAGDDAERAAVDTVALRFFTATPAGLVNERAEQVLAEYHALTQRNRINGAGGGRPKKAPAEPSGNPVGSVSVPQMDSVEKPYPSTVSQKKEEEEE